MHELPLPNAVFSHEEEILRDEGKWNGVIPQMSVMCGTVMVSNMG